MPTIYGGWSFQSLIDYALTSVIKCSFYHLWYVYALVFAYPLLYLMMRFLTRKAVTVICAILYLLGVFVNSYSHLFSIPFINSLSETIDGFRISYLLTNIFFRALPLMWLGACVANKRGKPNKIICLALAAAGFGLLVAENLILHKVSDGVVMGHYIIFTIVCVYFLLMFAVQCRVKIKKETSARLRNMSTLIYCLHALIILVIKDILLPGINTVALFLLTSAVTAAISAGIVVLSEKKKFRFLKYLY